MTLSYDIVERILQFPYQKVIIISLHLFKKKSPKSWISGALGVNYFQNFSSCLTTLHFVCWVPQKVCPDHTSTCLPQTWGPPPTHNSPTKPLAVQRWLPPGHLYGTDQSAWSGHTLSSCCSWCHTYVLTTLTSCSWLSQHSQKHFCRGKECNKLHWLCYNLSFFW